MAKEINKQKLIELAKSNTRNAVARELGISDHTAQRLADELCIKFKQFKPTGRKKIKLVDS